jgi:hypothetical protein
VIRTRSTLFSERIELEASSHAIANFANFTFEKAAYFVEGNVRFAFLVSVSDLLSHIEKALLCSDFFCRHGYQIFASLHNPDNASKEASLIQYKHILFSKIDMR